MDIFWKVANYFNWHPFRAFAVSLIFWCLLLFSYILRGWRPQVRTLPMLIAAIAWLLFGLLDYWTYRERAYIRLDLLITLPAILLVSAVCWGIWLYSLFAVRE